MRYLVTLALLAPALAAQPLVLLPIADATTSSNQPTMNFGNAADLDFGKAFSSTPSFNVWFTRGHVAFDVGTFVGSSTVPVRATFFWYQSQANAAGCLDVSLHRVTAPWSEASVTWQNQPAHDPLEVSRACVGSSFDLGWKSFDVTALVQAWLDGSAADFGLVVRDPSESSAGAARPGLGHSREYFDPTLWPYLEIEYAETFGSGCTAHASVPQLGVVGGSSTMGEAIDLRVTGMLPNALAVAFFGLSNAQWLGAPLPLSLGQIGFPNCSIEIELALELPLGVLGGATVDVSIEVPTVPALDGASLYSQVIAVTPGMALEATNGLGFVMRL